jgi:hypothetical protein
MVLAWQYNAGMARLCIKRNAKWSLAGKALPAYAKRSSAQQSRRCDPWPGLAQDARLARAWQAKRSEAKQSQAKHGIAGSAQLSSAKFCFAL